MSVRVLVTGAAGQIGYSIIPMLCTGELFGDKMIDLVLLDIAPMEKTLKGVEMEVMDCSFPLVNSITPTVNFEEAFRDIDYAILIGSFPRKEGMSRADLLGKNKTIFIEQGKLLDKLSKKSVKVLVVGNPANTNCLIASLNAPSIPKKNFSCLTRLDHNRLKSQISQKFGFPSCNVEHVAIWGNHSATQYPDISNAYVKNGSGKIFVKTNVRHKYLTEDLYPTVQKRGEAIINARGSSSAMSAARAIIDQLKSWIQGTKENEWVSMGVISDGSYGTTPGLVFSFPVTCNGGEYSIVKDLTIDDHSKKYIMKTNSELESEIKTALGN